MYARFYHLKKDPFHVTPDPEFLYLSPTHKEALASIIYGVNEGKGFIVITGEVGVGKTTVLRSYLERLNEKESRIIYVFNPNVSFKELLEHIFQELNLDPKTDDTNKMVSRLHQFMIEECREGRSLVLMIDEAQNMPVDTLENLRMLSNLETSTDKLIQIVLIGQPEFEEILNRNELRQLKQRIAIACRISPLSRKESAAYIKHRLMKAGMNRGPIFTRMALREIIKRAKGSPRVINILCDNALIAGVGYRKKPVGLKIVDRVIADYQWKKRPSLRRWATLPVAAMFVAACLFLLSPYSGALRSSLEDNYRQILGVAPARVEASVSTQENSSVAVGVPLMAETPELSTAAAKEPELFSPPTEVPGASSEARMIVLPIKMKPQSADGVPETPEAQFPVVRAMKDGQNLFRLTREVYGRSDPRLIEWVMENNPWISDVTKIPNGKEIVFPEPPEGQ
jgi:general secretion pathway protein A